jgi:predicted PurR-regulated permease PerM
LAIIGVPYALLLGVLAFVFGFIPVFGMLISGALCVLLAVPQGWLIAVIVLVYFVVVHVIESDIVGPRIVGQSISLHPVVSLAALIAGAELFGIGGALFASPVAGVLQALLIAIWLEWRATHPHHFQRPPADNAAATAADVEAAYDSASTPLLLP